MDDLAHADGGHIAVALVGNHNPVGQHAFDAGRHGRGAPVRGLHQVEVEIVVGKDRAAHRGHADRVFAQAHLVHHLGDQAVGDAVGAARAVVGGDIRQGFRARIDKCIRDVHVTIMTS